MARYLRQRCGFSTVRGMVHLPFHTTTLGHSQGCKCGLKQLVSGHAILLRPTGDRDHQGDYHSGGQKKPLCEETGGTLYGRHREKAVVDFSIIL